MNHDPLPITMMNMHIIFSRIALCLKTAIWTDTTELIELTSDRCKLRTKQINDADIKFVNYLKRN